MIKNKVRTQIFINSMLSIENITHEIQGLERAISVRQKLMVRELPKAEAKNEKRSIFHTFKNHLVELLIILRGLSIDIIQKIDLCDIHEQE